MKHFKPFLKIAVALTGAVIFFTASAFAQSALSSNRWLFVVETSRAMKKQLPAAQECVQGLLLSAMNGQMRAGDTFGVWTYDSELHAGDFPMQLWTPDVRLGLAQFTANFIKQQKCKGKAHLDKVMPDLLGLIQSSDTITVLVFSDGYEPFEGTPFDETVNTIYEQHRKELRDAEIPFVTVLQGRGGTITKCTINSTVGMISIPAIPQPEIIVQKPEPQPVVEAAAVPIAPAAPVKTNAPLILDYSFGKAPTSARERRAKAAEAAARVNASPPPAQAVALPPPPVVETAKVEELDGQTPSAAPETSAAQPVEAVKPALPKWAVASSAPPAAESKLPTQPVALAASGDSPAGLGFLIAAVVVLLVAVGLFILLRRDQTSAASSSLITESFDKKK